eukprot:g10091.t1
MSAVEARNGRVDVEVPADEDAKQCARLLRDPNANLKSIDLRRGLVTSAGAGAIAKALKGNSSLRHLGLPGNSIGDVGVAAIGKAVEGNLGCALTSVDLSATGITVVGLSNLVQGVSRLPNLHTVCLNDNNLAQEAGLQLSNLLKASASLHTVLAGGNYLGDRGLAALCGAFCYLKPARVLSLDVSGNGIGDLGVQWLCKGISALCRNQSREDPNGGGSAGGGSGGSGGSGIRDLRLRGNNITHAGARELAKLLSEDRCARDLRELDLSMNTITADGFRPLAVSLRGCPELVRLDVAGCRLGPGGVDAAADLIAASGPKLRTVILTPKAEFADRVLGDRGGLAVALRQSLQRLADSLPFAGAVLEVGLGAFLRADPGAAASIEETLSERRDRAGVSGGGDGGKRDTPAPDAGRGGGGGEGGAGGGSSRSGEKLRLNSSSRMGSGRARADGPGTPSGMTSSGGRRPGGTTPRAGGIPTTPVSSSRVATRAREAGSRHGARGTGIERPKAGIERQKPGTAERVRRGAAPRASPGSAGASSTPPAGPSLHRASSKASVRGANGSGKSSSERSRQQHMQQHKTTAATLAARDRAAAAEPAPHKRMHQGEELDSIDGFMPTEARHALPPPPSSSSSTIPPASSSSRRLLSSKASSATMVRTHSRSGSTSSFRDIEGGGQHEAGGGAVADSIADVVSKVMGDTAAMADDQESPPSVAPSTWEWSGDGHGEAAGARSNRRVVDEPAAPGGRGEGRKALSRKSSAASVRAVADSSGEPELSSGLASLAVTISDERRPRSDSRSQETTALRINSAGGGDSQQLVTVADASRMLAPIVAQEVEKETKKIEIRMQNEMNAALRTMRSEMEAIDREGLMARVAMEKRLKTGIKRLLDRIDHLERRFAKLEREDRKRLALEAASNTQSAAAPPALTDGAAGAGGAHGDLLLSPSSEGRAAGGSAAERVAAMSKGRRAGGGGCFTSDADSPESRPLVVREAWSGGDGGDDGKAALSVVSSTVASDEEFSESGDEAEADIVRMLEEKMAALEGKLLGHEERQRSDPRAGEGLGVGMPSAVYA